MTVKISTGLNPVLQCYSLNSDAKLPAKAHTSVFEDAAYDLYLPDTGTDIVLLPGERKLIGSGLCIIIPDGYWVKFHERSGLANKKGIAVMGGVIDSGYTGEWKVILKNTSEVFQTISSGTAIAQFTLEKVISADIVSINQELFEIENSKRVRGASGFGSTDKQ